MIRFALPGERDKLLTLYMRCFKDGRRFAEAVFSEIFRPDEAIIFEMDGDVMSMALLPRFELSNGMRAGYVYAACTEFALRGRGIMRSIMNAADEYMRYRGDDLSMLVPAEPSLFDYYARFGYKPAFRVKKYPALPADMRQARPEDTDFILRRYAEGSAGTYILRGREDIERLERLYSACGGGFYVNDKDYALYDGEKVAEGLPGAQTGEWRGMALRFKGDPGELDPGALFD